MYTLKIGELFYFTQAAPSFKLYGCDFSPLHITFPPTDNLHECSWQILPSVYKGVKLPLANVSPFNDE